MASNSLANRKTVFKSTQTRSLLLANWLRHAGAICLLLFICALSSSSAPRPKSGQLAGSFTRQPSCQTTRVRYTNHYLPDKHWRDRIKNSVAGANQILTYRAFAPAYQRMTMNRTNGKTVQKICREIAYAGDQSLNLDLFHDLNNRCSVRKAGDDIVQFNTAKPKSRAADAGNFAHELTHVLG